jgi:hypothetical protein
MVPFFDDLGNRVPNDESRVRIDVSLEERSRQ